MLIQGFSKKIDGADISWWSHLDYAKEAIIIHANKSNKSIEWESANIKVSSKLRPNLQVIESDVLGGDKENSNLVIKPWESKFVKIIL